MRFIDFHRILYTVKEFRQAFDVVNEYDTALI